MNCRLLHGAMGVVAGILVSGMPAAAAEPPELRYGFEKGQEYCYHVKIVGEVSELTSTYDGVLAYKVVAADDSQFQFSSNSELLPDHRNREGHSVAVLPPIWPGSPIKPMWMQGGPMGMGMGMGMEPVVQATGFSRTGRFIGSQSEAFLPFALGLQHSLVVEPLPEKREESWSQDDADVAVLKRMSGSSFFMRLGYFRSATHLSGKESIRYSIAERKDNVVCIRKVYSLQTPPDGEIVRFDMSGEGQFEFNVDRGLIQASKMQYKILVNEKNLTLTIPISLEYTAFSDAEMAEWQQKQGKVAESAGQPAALAPGEREQLLAKLQSGNEVDILAAARRLAQLAPTAERDDVARALMAAGSGRNPLVWGSLVPALEVWRTPETEKLLIDALNDQRGMLFGDSILTALARFRTPDAAKAIAKIMNSFRLRTAAAAALSTMGPVAEEYVIPMLDSRDRSLRTDAYAILGRIGGEKSLQALKKFAVERDAKEAREIHEAMEAIHRRGGLPPVMPEERKVAAEPAAGFGIPMVPRNPAGSFDRMGHTVDPVGPEAPAKPLAPTSDAGPVGPSQPVTEGALRKWKDVTRSFEVEARLVRFEGDKVTLLRANGRTVTLPLAKLCEEDQQFVKNHADAENPFR